MIRIPFSSGTEARKVHSSPAHDSVDPGGTKEQLESRMRLLEIKLGEHAEELKTNIERRVERIESRVTRAMVSLGTEPEDDRAHNVLQFGEPKNKSHHLPATSAIAALNELNNTLEMTRNHMEALDRSVSRIRRTLSR